MTKKADETAGSVRDILIKQKKNLQKKYFKDGAKPPKYNSVEDMIFMVEQYVTDGCQIKTTVHGTGQRKFIVQTRRLSLYDLALHLGFSSRKQMNNFADNHPDYAEVIRLGRTYVARYYEGLGQDGVSPTFMNFMLHNIDGLVMSKEDQDGGYVKKKARLKFTNHDKQGKVKALNERTGT